MPTLRRTLRNDPLRRSGAVIGALCCWVLVVVHVLTALDVVFVRRIGPVVAVLDAAGGHGVHRGDLLALPLMGLACAWFIGGVVLTSAVTAPSRALPWRGA